MTVGERIKRLRRAKGMSQVEFAEAIDVSKQTLYKYERDIILTIPYDKIERIAALCGTTPQRVLGWEDPREMTAPGSDRSRRLRDYLLNVYDKLDEVDRGRLIGTAETLLKEYEGQDER